jgi:hypothetical protein
MLSINAHLGELLPACHPHPALYYKTDFLQTLGQHLITPFVFQKAHIVGDTLTFQDLPHKVMRVVGAILFLPVTLLSVACGALLLAVSPTYNLQRRMCRLLTITAKEYLMARVTCSYEKIYKMIVLRAHAWPEGGTASERCARDQPNGQPVMHEHRELISWMKGLRYEITVQRLACSQLAAKIYPLHEVFRIEEEQAREIAYLYRPSWSTDCDRWLPSLLTPRTTAYALT